VNIYQVLEIPAVYRLAQTVLAPGMGGIVTGRISEALSKLQKPVKVLDVGCGPSSWLWQLGIKPIGLDFCHAYTRKFRAAGNHSITASAAALPFLAEAFDLVFSYGLIHHLPDELARQTIAEIVRTTRQGGTAILFDPVLPRMPLVRPQAWALCKLDRGRFIRAQRDYEESILVDASWQTRRFTHSYLGTEGILSVFNKTYAGN
jgi:SAM-dependent methyltransferase